MERMQNLLMALLLAVMAVVATGCTAPGKYFEHGPMATGGDGGSGGSSK